MDSSNPFTQSSGFLDPLSSQQCDPVSQSIALGSSEVPLFSSHGTNAPTQAEETTEDIRGGRNWSQKEDVVLIRAWLNTSKDPIIGYDRRPGSFWKRVGAYFNASPHLVGMPDREVGNCKQRWSKINDQVNEFVGSLCAATRMQSSGRNDNDVMKLANEIYHNDYGAKFTLEHCWRELKNEQKWRVDFGTEEARPEGVKKAKARLKAQRSAKEMEATSRKRMEKLQEMFEKKKHDYEMKEKLIKQNMLETLLARKEPLSEIELAFKNKLIKDMLS